MNRFAWTVLLALLTSGVALAETKVSVYSVPFGVVGDIGPSNFRALENRLRGIPSQSFTLNERDMVISGDGITVSLENKGDRVGNFNRMLAAVYAYAKTIPEVDAVAVKQAVASLSVYQDGASGGEDLR